MWRRFLNKIQDWWRGNTFGAARSNQWSSKKKEFAKTHPKKCAVCENIRCDLHHCIPFHEDNSKELLDENLIWLCQGLLTKNHHFEFGHLFSWKSWNADVEADASAFNLKIKNRPI